MNQHSKAPAIVFMRVSSSNDVFLKETPKDIPEYPLLGSTRLGVAFLILLSTCLQYSQRMDLNVNIICMVNHSAVIDLLNDKQSPNFSTHLSDGPFIWPKSVQAMTISTFFWGYLLSQIPGGVLANRYGAKWVMAYAMFANSICILLYRSAANVHYTALMFLRFIVGLGGGVLFPCISQIWTNWAPKQDRSFLIGIGVSGGHIGNVFTLILGGYLCSTTNSNRWHYLFCIIGISTLVWVVLWSVIYSNSPVTQRCMSANEKAYIMQSISKPSCFTTYHAYKIPWSAIMLSIPCWSQFICHLSLNWGFYTLFTCTPTYMSEVLHFDIKSNGTLSSIPFAMVWLFTTCSSFISDRLIEKKWLSRTVVRKLANLIGSIIPAITLIGMCFITKTTASLGIVLLSVGMGAFGVAYGSGFLCVCNDMSSNYASIMFGISNTLATLPGIIAPFLISRITKNRTLNEWRTVFIITSIIWSIGGIQFAVFGAAETQTFDNESKTGPEIETKMLRSCNL